MVLLLEAAGVKKHGRSGQAGGPQAAHAAVTNANKTAKITEKLPTEPQLADWIDQAKKLPPGRGKINEPKSRWVIPRPSNLGRPQALHASVFCRNLLESATRQCPLYVNRSPYRVPSGQIPAGATIGGRFRVDGLAVAGRGQPDLSRHRHQPPERGGRARHPDARAGRVGGAARDRRRERERARPQEPGRGPDRRARGGLLLHRDRAAGRPDAARVHRRQAPRGRGRVSFRGRLQPHHPHRQRAGARGQHDAARRAQPGDRLGEQGGPRQGRRPRVWRARCRCWRAGACPPGAPGARLPGARAAGRRTADAGLRRLRAGRDSVRGADRPPAGAAAANLAAAGSDAPSGIDGFIAKALARDPGARFHSPMELRQALASLQSGASSGVSAVRCPAARAGPRAARGGAPASGDVRGAAAAQSPPQAQQTQAPAAGVFQVSAGPAGGAGAGPRPGAAAQDPGAAQPGARRPPQHVRPLVQPGRGRGRRDRRRAGALADPEGPPRLRAVLARADPRADSARRDHRRAHDRRQRHGRAQEGEGLPAAARFRAQLSERQIEQNRRAHAEIRHEKSEKAKSAFTMLVVSIVGARRSAGGGRPGTC